MTISQTGYLSGLVVFVPLDDLLDRRRLVVGLAAASALGLSLAAVSSETLLPLVAVGAFGATTVLGHQCPFVGHDATHATAATGR